MAHFAKLDENNVVQQVIVVDNNETHDENGIESEQKGIDFCNNIFGGTWVQTSYNAKIRKNYAGYTYTYDKERDAFIPPKRFPSWILNEETCNWEPPTPMPAGAYIWDEETVSWKPAPSPYPSWVGGETNGIWQPPVPFPDDKTKPYQWDEATTSWTTTAPSIQPII